MDSKCDDHAAETGYGVQQQQQQQGLSGSTEEEMSRESRSGSSPEPHCINLTVAQQAINNITNGGIGIDHSLVESSMEVPVGTETVVSDHLQIVEQENTAIASSNQTESHITTRQASPKEVNPNPASTHVVTTEPTSSSGGTMSTQITLEDAGHETSDGMETSHCDVVDQNVNGESVINVQVVTTEPTSTSGADQIASEDSRPVNSDGTEVEMTVFRSSDVVDQNVNHETILNRSTMPELTEDSPPSYESVVKTTVIQVPTEKADNDTDVITTQPQSSVVTSPVADMDNANTMDHDSSDSDPELAATIDYLRRRRHERRNVDTEFCDNLELCCTVCYICCPPGGGTSRHDIETRSDCVQGCFEVSWD